jgi:hypothetical protein
MTIIFIISTYCDTQKVNKLISYSVMIQMLDQRDEAPNIKTKEVIFYSWSKKIYN